MTNKNSKSKGFTVLYATLEMIKVRLFEAIFLRILQTFSKNSLV